MRERILDHNRMYRRRRELGLYQYQVAERAGLTERGYSHIENGTRPNPQAMTLYRIAKALEVDMNELFIGKFE